MNCYLHVNVCRKWTVRKWQVISISGRRLAFDTNCFINFWAIVVLLDCWICWSKVCFWNIILSVLVLILKSLPSEGSPVPAVRGRWECLVDNAGGYITKKQCWRFKIRFYLILIQFLRSCQGATPTNFWLMGSGKMHQVFNNNFGSLFLSCLRSRSGWKWRWWASLGPYCWRGGGRGGG